MNRQGCIISTDRKLGTLAQPLRGDFGHLTQWSLTLISHLSPLFPSGRVHPFTTRISPQVHSVSQPRMKLVFLKVLSITESDLEVCSLDWEKGRGGVSSLTLVLKPFSASFLYPKHTFNTDFRLAAVRQMQMMSSGPFCHLLLTVERLLIIV